MPPENKKSEARSFFRFVPIKTIIIAVNRLRKSGIKIKVNGIKILKFSSNVKELDIHEIPVK